MEANAKRHCSPYLDKAESSIAQHFGIHNLPMITAGDRLNATLQVILSAQIGVQNCGWLHTQAQERGLSALALPARRRGDAQFK